MKVTSELARHLRELYIGENWTSSSLKDLVADLHWKEATTRIHGLNSIAALVFHMTYYIRAVTEVLQGKPLTARDKHSFELPPIQSETDWNALLNNTWKDVERCAELIEQLPEDRLWDDFWEDQYGHYYRNLQGVIEHAQYHLGQVALIKKMIRQAPEHAEPE